MSLLSIRWLLHRVGSTDCAGSATLLIKRSWQSPLTGRSLSRIPGGGHGWPAVWLQDGKVWGGSSRSPDSRTAVAIDRQRKLLFLALGQYISPRRLLQDLADLGAKDGMLLDGGGSSSMAIGKGAAGVPAGVLYGGWRPVATHFGVRAQRLRTQGHSSSLVEPIRF